MDEKQSTFTVTDRRKFTLDGALRDEAPVAEHPEETPATPPGAAASEKVVTMPAPQGTEAPPAETADADAPQFSAQETADQRAAYQESSRQLDDMLRKANPGMEATGTVTFEHIIQSFYISAMMAMGAGVREGVVYDRPAESTDLVPTLGSMLGFSASLSQGKPIPELL